MGREVLTIMILQNKRESYVGRSRRCIVLEQTALGLQSFINEGADAVSHERGQAGTWARSLSVPVSAAGMSCSELQGC